MALFAVAISAAVNTRPIITVSRYRGARLYDANGCRGFFSLSYKLGSETAVRFQTSTGDFRLRERERGGGEGEGEGEGEREREREREREGEGERERERERERDRQTDREQDNYCKLNFARM